MYEDEHTPTGTRVFKVVGDKPGEVGMVIWPKSWTTPDFIAELEKEAKKQAGRQLRIV